MDGNKAKPNNIIRVIILLCAPQLRHAVHYYIVGSVSSINKIMGGNTTVHKIKKNPNKITNTIDI